MRTKTANTYESQVSLRSPISATAKRLSLLAVEIVISIAVIWAGFSVIYPAIIDTAYPGKHGSAKFVEKLKDDVRNLGQAAKGDAHGWVVKTYENANNSVSGGAQDGIRKGIAASGGSKNGELLGNLGQ